MRIIDILSQAAARIVAQADNGFLYVARPQHEDGFQSLRHATLHPNEYKWGAWNVGDESDISELASNLKEQAIRDYGFPYRSKAAQPA
jgi:hypothetical protein